MVLDNASYHKSHAVNAYVEGANGAIDLEFLPPYTPQLNQIENDKRRLAGRYFRSTDELKRAITVSGARIPQAQGLLGSLIEFV